MSIPAIFSFSEKTALCDRLFHEYAEHVRDLDALKLDVSRFQQRYASAVRERVDELNRLNALIAAAVREKNASLFLNHDHGHKDDLEPSIEFSLIPLGQQKKVVPNQTSADAKKLYRRIASIIHPDKAKNGESNPLRTRLMSELNEAYARKDIIKMQSVLERWQESPDAVTGEGPEAEMQKFDKLIVQLKKSMSGIEQEISRIMNTDIYRLMRQVEDSDLAGRDIIQEMQAMFDVKIGEAQNRLIIKKYG
ncbi:MAG: J domain-containing protein [Chlorobiaceae bacterium]|nr:J domain-containing protein [Chlorobiaceae bacterium]